MEEMKLYRVGLEQLDDYGTPVEHIDLWEEIPNSQEDTTALRMAINRYELLNITNRTAKYLMAVDENGDEMILQSEGYKYEK